MAEDKQMKDLAKVVFDRMRIHEPEKFARYERMKNPLYWEARKLMEEG